MALARLTKRLQGPPPRFSAVDPDKPYPMAQPKLGHAVIVNNVASEMPGSNADVTALQMAYEKVGFQVHVHKDLNSQQMRKVKKFIMADDTHAQSNCFILTIICHGNERGHLLDKEKRKAWDTELFVGDLSDVDSLAGKPKIMVIQACRGAQSSEGKPAPARTHARTLSVPEDKEATCFLPDKADMFLAYATVPGFKADAGGSKGSLYLQTLARYLQDEYMVRSLERILKMVRQHMIKQQGGTDVMKQCPEERNSLVYDVMFSEFHRNGDAAVAKPRSPDCTVDQHVVKEQQKEFEKQREEMERKNKDLEEKHKEMERKVEEERKKNERLQSELEKKEKAEAERIKKEGDAKAQKGEKERMKKLKKEEKKKTDKAKTEKEEKAETERLAKEREQKAQKEEKERSKKLKKEEKKKTDKTEKMEEKKMAEKGPKVEEKKKSAKEKKTEKQKEKPDAEKKSGKDKVKEIGKTEKGKKKKTEEIPANSSNHLYVPTNPVKPKSPLFSRLKNKVLKDGDVTPRNVELSVLSTFSTGLDWTTEKFAVMPSSGHIVLPGWGARADLKIFKLKDGSLSQTQSVASPCRHSDFHLLPVTIGSRELLAVSCRACREIRLLDVQRTDRVVGESAVWNREQLFENMCHGEPGRVYVRAWDNVLEMDSTQLKFTGPINTLNTGVTMCTDMCYIPAPYKTMVLSDKSSIIAHSVDDNKTTWKASDTLDGEFCQPMGMLYLPKHHVLLVCDGWNNRMLVLHPGDGSHLQTLTFGSQMGDIKDVCLYEGGALLLHTAGHQCKISQLSLK